MRKFFEALGLLFGIAILVSIMAVVNKCAAQGGDLYEKLSEVNSQYFSIMADLTPPQSPSINTYSVPPIPYTLPAYGTITDFAWYEESVISYRQVYTGYRSSSFRVYSQSSIWMDFSNTPGAKYGARVTSGYYVW